MLLSGIISLSLIAIHGDRISQLFCHLVFLCDLWAFPIRSIHNSCEEDDTDEESGNPSQPNALEVQLECEAEDSSQSNSDKVEAQNIDS
jgi:hypothetical protein